MFKLTRQIVIISLINIVDTTTVLTLFYRQVTIRTTANLAQASGLNLAQTALISVRRELDDYLAIGAHAGTQEFAARRLAAWLTEVVKELMPDSVVVRINMAPARGLRPRRCSPPRC